jgi:hypothetical protein
MRPQHGWQCSSGDNDVLAVGKGDGVLAVGGGGGLDRVAIHNFLRSESLPTIELTPQCFSFRKDLCLARVPGLNCLGLWSANIDLCANRPSCSMDGEGIYDTTTVPSLHSGGPAGCPFAPRRRRRVQQPLGHP